MTWSFDDDRGQHIVTASRPIRVLAYAQAAQTLTSLGVPVVGYFGSQHHADSGSSVGLDLPFVGSGDAVDEDLVKSLDPDLVVSVTYGGEVYGLSEAVAARVAEVAPVLALGIAGDRTLESVIERFHEVASALGADVQDPATELTSAPTDSSVRVVALSGGTDTDAYVANPAYWPSVRMLADAGVQFTSTTTASGWEVVKWDELATKHPGRRRAVRPAAELPRCRPAGDDPGVGRGARRTCGQGAAVEPGAAADLRGGRVLRQRPRAAVIISSRGTTFTRSRACA